MFQIPFHFIHCQQCQHQLILENLDYVWHLSSYHIYTKQNIFQSAWWDLDLQKDVVLHVQKTLTKMWRQKALVWTVQQAQLPNRTHELISGNVVSNAQLKCVISYTYHGHKLLSLFLIRPVEWNWNYLWP